MVQSDTLDQVDKIVHAVGIGRLLFHLLARVLEIGSRSAHGEGEFGAFVGEREGYGFWRSNSGENPRQVGDLETVNLTPGRVVAPDQELHRTDLYQMSAMEDHPKR